MRYHITPVKMAIIKKIRNNVAVRMWRKGNTVCGNVNWYSLDAKEYGGTSEN